MIADVFLDLIGLEFGEILNSESAIHDGEGNWSSGDFGDVGNHGAPHWKSTRRRVNLPTGGSVKVLEERKKGKKGLEIMNGVGSGVNPWTSLLLT